MVPAPEANRALHNRLLSHEAFLGPVVAGYQNGRACREAHSTSLFRTAAHLASCSIRRNALVLLIHIGIGIGEQWAQTKHFVGAGEMFSCGLVAHAFNSVTAAMRSCLAVESLDLHEHCARRTHSTECECRGVRGKLEPPWPAPIYC